MVGYLEMVGLTYSGRMACMTLVLLFIASGCVSNSDGMRAETAEATHEQYLDPLDEAVLQLFAEREMLDDPIHFRVISRSGDESIRTFVSPDLKEASEVREYDPSEENFRIIGADDPEQEYIEVVMKVRKSEYGITAENPLQKIVPALALTVGNDTCWVECKIEGGIHVEEQVCY